MMPNTEKIAPQHLARPAVVYVLNQPLARYVIIMKAGGVNMTSRRAPSSWAGVRSR
jgi:hypothetical protein